MRRANIEEPEFDYDPEDPEGFRAGMFRPGPDLGASMLGASVYELPPGQALCPYHYEYGEEEWLLVLRGTATVRTPEGEEELGPWDLTCFPPGPDGAHQVRNATGETPQGADVLQPRRTGGHRLPGQRQDRDPHRQPR